MPHKLPEHVKRVRSKGRTYYYFNTGKTVDGKRVYTRLPDIGDRRFWDSYAACKGHRNRAPTILLQVPKLIDLYQRSPAYKDLKPSSRRVYDIYLARLERLMPSAPVSEIRRVHMQRLFDAMADTPGAANLFLATCGSMFKWAKRREYIKENPCLDIEPFKLGEHKPWPEHVLNEALASDDKRVRLLTHLLFYTAQRLNDVLDMTWHDWTGDYIAVKQEKTEKAYPLPVHSRLRAVLEATPKRGINIVTNFRGQRLDETTARNALKAFASSKGVKRVPHGLRKNAVNALLELGCTEAETASISGQSLQVVRHYAKERDQSKLRSAAILKWEKNGS